jgi:hypothetical protein
LAPFKSKQEPSPERPATLPPHATVAIPNSKPALADVQSPHRKVRRRKINFSGSLGRAF